MTERTVRKSEVEIEAEWKELRKMRGAIPRLTRYRVDQWAMVDASVLVMRYELEMGDIVRQFQDLDVRGGRRT